MGNEWDEIEREKRSSIPCPCGSGEHRTDSVTYRDNYMRQDSQTESYITCKNCAEQFAYYPGFGWLPQQEVQAYNDLEKLRKKDQAKLTRELTRKYQEQVLRMLGEIKNQTALYAFLKESKGIYMPGTVQTFRKHLKSYGLIHFVQRLDPDHLMSLASRLKVPMNDQDASLLTEWNQLHTKNHEFLKLRCVKTV